MENFIGGVDKANNALDRLRPQETIFEKAWDSITGTLGKFADKVWDVASVTIGVLLRDAIRDAISWLGELVSSAFEAGQEFQLMALRLQGFNLQALVDSGQQYVDVMGEAVRVTEDQMSWILKLAATTPYDATDIGFVFTMSEAFGFSADQAKSLTQNTLDFVAAMGLTGVEAKRVIINLGQMAQRGKITTREMNDLARGSLLPLNDVLTRVAEKMGVTVSELTALISKPGEGVDYKLFMDAFEEMIGEEVRFKGAAQNMAHTFQGAMENVFQTLRDFIGKYVLLPGILDPIGKKVGTLMDTIGLPKNWDIITNKFQKIGDALGKISTKLLDAFFPKGSEQTIVDRIVLALDTISTWLERHSDDIINFFLGTQLFKPISGEQRKINILEGFEEPIPGRTGGVVGFFAELIKGLEDVRDTVIEIAPYVLDFFKGIGDFVQAYIVPFINDQLIPAFNTIKQWVNDNQDTINSFFGSLGNIAGQVISILTGGEFIEGALGKQEKTPLEIVLEAIETFMKFVVDNQDAIANFIASLIRIWIIAEIVKTIFAAILDIIGLIVAISFDAFIVTLTGIGLLIGGMRDAAQELLTILQSIFSLQQPGSLGPTPPLIGPPAPVEPGGGPGGRSAPGTSLGAPSVVSMPATSVSTSTSSQTNFNLTIHTNAPKESILQDFSTLQALA